MSVQPSFIFGGNTGVSSPEELARLRAIADALSAPRAPKNVGEGLSALGDALGYRMTVGKANDMQAKGDASASSAIMSALGGGQFPAAPTGGGGAVSSALSSPSPSGAAAPAQTADSGPPSDIEAYIRQSAAAKGIDPDVAVTVARSEGGLKDPTRQSLARKNGVQEPSYGPFQLLVGGGQTGFPAGMGNQALAAGIDPRDPANWKKGVDFALDQAKQKGWGQWYGAKAAGITGMHGIGNAPIAAAAPQAPQQVASLDPSVGMPAAPSPVAAALQLPQQGPIPQGRPDVVAALNGAPAPQPGEVGGPGATTPAGQRVLGQMMSPLPMGGQPMQMQPPAGAAPPLPSSQIAPDPMAAQDQSGKPQGPGTPGEIRKGADGKTYQYAQTTGMAGATGDSGWIETSMPAQQQGGGPDMSQYPVIAGGSADAIQPGQGGPSVQQLMQAAQNPWLKPEQRQLVNQLLAQKMQEQDPLRQLQIKAAQKSLATPPKQWQKLDDNTLFDPASGEVKEINGGAGEPLFKGNSVEAQSLNGLVTSGALTKDQALQLGAGKTVTDPTTGAILFMTPQGIFAKPTDGSAPQPVAPGAAPAAQPASAPPPANPGMIPVTGGKVTADERNAMTYADRMAVSGGIIDSMGMKGSGFLDQVGSHAPFGLDNYATSDEFKKVDQAKRDFVNAQLRRESGAAISAGEFDSANKQYFPQPNDPPEVIEQKRKNRELVIEGMKRDAGPTYKPREKPKGAAPAVIDGYTIEEVQ